MAKYINVDDEELWDQFAQDIAEEDQENILQQMSEALHDKRYENETVTITDRHWSNIINVTGQGIVTYKGKEFDFHLSSGDWNGTELHGWGELGSTYEEPVHDPLTFQPDDLLIQQAMGNNGDPAFLLKKWDLFKTRSDISEAIRKYAYDRHFQPGGKIENHYKPQFKTWRLEVVVQSTADETRKMLEKRVKELASKA